MLRTAIPFTVILMAGAALGQTGKSKGALSPAEQAAAIEAVRQYALSYTKSLPNYTCTLTTTHISRPPNAVNNPSLESTVIEEQLNFVDNKEIRTTTRIDGRAVPPDAADKPSGLSKGEFGNLLDIIFDPATGTDLRWERAASLNNTGVDVFVFHVPQSRGYFLNGSRGAIRVPFEGFVYADSQTRAVLRIQMKCTGIPSNSEYRTLDLTLDYKAAQVAGQDLILPFHFLLHFISGDREQTNEARYSAYRRFSADAKIQFEPESGRADPVPER